MTREKAIEIINYHKILVDRDKSGLLDKKLEYEAIDMAIKALKQGEELCDQLNAVEEENERLREENERLIEEMDDLRDRTYDYLMLEE